MSVARTLVDLSHDVEHGMVTFKGLPAPYICDFLSREDSRGRYDAGTEFQIGRIDMVANTGTYVDAPFHRFADGADLAGLRLEQLADIEGVLVSVPFRTRLDVGREHFETLDVRNKAVLVHTGWDAFWRTDAYFDHHPYLTESAAVHLRDAGAVIVGIDSHNIDDTRGGARPVHTTLLGAGIPIVEHLCRLQQLDGQPFRFSAVPVKVRGMGTFPVRAYATITPHPLAGE